MGLNTFAVAMVRDGVGAELSKRNVPATAANVRTVAVEMLKEAQRAQAEAEAEYAALRAGTIAQAREEAQGSGF